MGARFAQVSLFGSGLGETQFPPFTTKPSSHTHAGVRSVWTWQLEFAPQVSGSQGLSMHPPAPSLISPAGHTMAKRTV